MTQVHSHPIWLQDVSPSWSIKRIKHATYLKARVGWHGLTSSDYLNQGVLLVTGTDFQGGRVNWKTCHHVSEDRYQQDPYIQLREGDLLITKDGTIGKIALVEDLEEPATLNSGIFVTRPLNGIYSNQFMYWLLQSRIFQSFIDYIKVGTTINHLYQNQLSDFAFPVPSIETQKSIAHFLDRKTAAIDTLIAKKQRLIQLLEEKRTALINQAVTKGLNPNAPMKDSGIPWIGKIPEHWEVLQIKRAFILQRGVDTTKEAQTEGIVPVVSSGGIASYHNVALAKAPGVLVGRKGTIGKVHYVEQDFWPHSTALWVINFYSNYPRFIYYKLLSMKLEDLDTGSSNPTLNRNLVHPIETSWPPRSEQIEIANLLDSYSKKVDEIRSKIDEQIEKLQEYRRSLITAAVTGKLDIQEVDHAS